MKKGKSQSKLHPDQLETSKQYERIQNYNNDITEIKKEVDQIQKQIDEEISKNSTLSLSNEFTDEEYSPNLTPNQSSATKRKTRTENHSTKQQHGEKPHQREIYHQTGTEKVIPMSFDSYELIEQLKTDNTVLSHKLKKYASKKTENEKTIKNLQKELNEAHKNINNLKQKNQVLLDNNQQPKFIDSKLIKETLPKTEPDSLIQLDNNFYQKFNSNDSDKQQLIQSLIELKRKENDLTVQIEKLNTVNRDLQNRLDFANHQKDSEGKAESEKISQMNKKCADLTEENRQLKIQLINETTLKIENDELKKKLNEKTKSETKESQTIAELTEKWSNLAKENMVLKTSLSQMNSIENQNKELVSQIENLQKQNADLKAKLEEERKKSKTESKPISKSPKKAKSKSRSKSPSKTKETNQDSPSKIDDQNELNSNNQNQVNSTDKNQLNDETQRLQNELNEAKETIIQMENGFELEKKELEKKYNEIIDNFTKNIKNMSNSHESSYKKEIKSLESQLEHQKQLYSQLVNVNEKLLDQLNKSHSNNLSLITQMDELQHSENICQSINYSNSPIKNNTSDMNSSRPFEEDDQQFNELKKATELLQKTLQEDIESRQNSPQKKSPKQSKRAKSPKRSKSLKNKKNSKKSPQKASANINETPNKNQKQSNKIDVSPHSNNSKKPNASNTENSIQQKDATQIETNHQNQNSTNELNKSDSNNTIETKTIFSIQLESPSNHVSIELESTNQKSQENSNEKLPEKQNDDINQDDFDIESENEQLGSSISFSDLEKVDKIDEGDEHKSENKRDRGKYSQLNYNSEEDFDDTDPLYCDFIYK